MADDPKKPEALAQVRQKIQIRIQMAEEAKKLDLQRRRITIAGKGVNAYSEKHLGEAATAFRGYVKILEDLKGAPAGGLTPAHFDPKAEMAEMMLLSGVYWDLTKLYDRTRSAERYADFKGYLGKYILFSKGLPYQTMSAETMRKYLRAGRAVHKQDFKNAYNQIALSKCFVATELDEYAAEETLAALRGFRDEVLRESPGGRAFVAWYYRRGPGIAKRVARFPEPAKVIAARALDVIGWGARRWPR